MGVCDIIKPMKRGNRCTICTGCGRCFGEYEFKPDIISYSGSEDLKVSLPGPVICADIGTTTIAMILVDEKGNVKDHFAALNPQGKYGADVLSRIKAAADTEALDDMKASVREVLNRGAKQFMKKLKADAACVPAPKMYISANTTMTYLCMGYDPAELGEAPFHAEHIKGENFKLNADSTDIDAYILPGYSAFVGGDIYAGVIASDLCAGEKYRLLCDLGTNGEIALGNKDHLYVTATAAGPAFEGGPCKGIWGSDMISLTSALLKENILDNTGLLKEPYLEEGITIGNVYITGDSVRALQLAKGAMNAGIRILCDAAGIGFEDIENCILAGGFGIKLDPGAAAHIGLIPKELVSVCIPGGNTALKGALKYAAGARSLLSPMVINLAEDPGFNDLYIGSLDFPVK